MYLNFEKFQNNEFSIKDNLGKSRCPNAKTHYSIFQIIIRTYASLHLR